MDGQLSIDELSRWTGEPPERLLEWRSLGLIGATDNEEFAPDDEERVRLIKLSLARGVSLDTIVQAANQSGGLLWAAYRDVLRTSTRRVSVAEVGAELKLDEGLLRRLWQAAGFEPEEMLDEADLEMVRSIKVGLDAGFPEEAMLQIVRVYGDAFGRVADAEARLFRFYVQERLRATGMEESELNRTLQESSVQLYGIVEPAILYFHRKSLLRAVREDTVLSLAEAAGLVEAGDVPGKLQVAVVFVDISSFTPLAEAMGDVTAAQVLSDFSELVREAAGVRQGRVIKQMGDAFMLVFPDARSAVLCTLDMERRAAATPLFPAVRSGIHSGPALYREGDYFGSNVNIASRLLAEAGRHQVLVTGAVQREVGAIEGVEFVPLGKRALKGLAVEAELFEAKSMQHEPERKLVDPVCGMELAPDEVAAGLSLEGQERAFCSEECLRRFVAGPGQSKVEP